MAGQDERKSNYRERNSTADRALDILTLFDDERLTVTGQEVADSLGVARSTAYRYLQSLSAAGFLEEHPRVGFRLGPRVFELARLARRGIGLSEIALPIMHELGAQLGHTVLLTRRVGSAVVCLERVSSDSPLQLSYERGHILPINAGASALALLAWAPEEEVARALASTSLPKLTPATVTSTKALNARLKEIRATGYAVSRGELDQDILGVAVPIRDASTSVVAAVSVTCLSHRTPDRELPTLAAAIQAAAERISDRLTLTSG
jgi:DNA-binding IclR family transcriptional regulator